MQIDVSPRSTVITDLFKKNKDNDYFFIFFHEN